MALRNTPWVSAAAVASFNPGRQQMLQIGPRTPSVTQPPSKWPFNLNHSPQRGPIKEEASRARSTGKSFEGRRPQGCLAKGSPTPFTRCARMWTVGLRVGWRAAPETGAEMQYRWQQEWRWHRIVSLGLKLPKWDLQFWPALFREETPAPAALEMASDYQLLCRDQIFVAH